MKTTRLLWCLVMCVFITSAGAQTYTYQNVNELLKKSEQDSVAHIERLAALEFHKLINQYRQDNGLGTIKWNETLWIATINHNTWMDKAGDLSHHQKANTKYFTGISPGNRLDYAAGGDASISWSGENALYNYSCRGNTKEEMAKNIAKQSFIQWKNSPGHNANMLGKRHGSHGVAFRITSGMVWGTDLFSSADYEYTPDPTQFYAQAKTKSSKPKTKRFSTFKNKQIIQEDVSDLLSDAMDLKGRSFIKGDAAKRKAYRISRTKQNPNSDGVVLTETEHTTKRTFLGLFNKSVHTYSAILERDIDTFDSKEVSKELTTMLKHNQPFNKKSKVDIALVLKKKKDKVRVTMVSVLYNPVGKINSF